MRDFNYGDPEWHIELPAEAITDGKIDLRFEVEEPSSPLELGWSSDDRRIGILLLRAGAASGRRRRREGGACS